MKVLVSMMAFVVSMTVLYAVDPNLAFFVMFMVVIYAIHDAWF